jgi:LmbE family N-acetylglucosaminyl deacetylase
MNSCSLPTWQSVLAVVAHPDDESFGLGAVLSAFTDRGSTVSVLCLTRGEASTLHGVSGDLTTIRSHELHSAARILGVATVWLKTHPDGALADVAPAALASDIDQVAQATAADGVVVFDTSGITEHPDHIRATQIAIEVAARRNLGVLGWTIPSDVAATLNAELGTAFVGHAPRDIDLVLQVDRGAQSRAVACHPSQAVPGSPLWRRLELLADREHLRWLVPVPASATTGE